jgi:hypothetical protein
MRLWFLHRQIPGTYCEKVFLVLGIKIRAASYSKACDFDLNCADGSDERNCGPCDFEADDCGWKDNSDGLYQWKRNAAKSSNGPPTDHVCSISKNFNSAKLIYTFFTCRPLGLLVVTSMLGVVTATSTNPSFLRAHPCRSRVQAAR